MFAYCLNNPIINVDSDGNASVWFYLLQAFKMGFIHMCVEAHIYSKYAIAGVEVELWLKDAGKLVGRADVMIGNQVWEIKHGGNDITAVARAQIAKAQAQNYIGAIAVRTGITVARLGDANVFEGTFTVTVRDSTCQVTYRTPEPGVILYFLEQTEYQEDADYVLFPVKSEKKSSANSQYAIQNDAAAAFIGMCAYAIANCYSDDVYVRQPCGVP